MSNKKAKKAKEAMSSYVKRSEYNDEILRNNQRTDNRLKIDMHYYDRAQKVIMKDLGKESLILQNKLDSDRKTLSLGLYGSKVGVTAAKTKPRYTPTSPMGTVTMSSSTFKPANRSTSRNDTTKFPWDRDVSDKASTGLDKDGTVISSRQGSSPLMKNSSSKFRIPSSSSYRPPADDFIASILNEAMNDELLYTQYPETTSPYKQTETVTPRPPRSSRRKSTKTPRSRMMMAPSDSLVNSLSNATQEADEVIY